MKPSVRKTISVVLLILAVAFVVIGVLREHKVLDSVAVAAEFGIVTYQNISEKQLVEDATFAGTVRRDGELRSTYDRSVERGKKACPT